MGGHRLLYVASIALLIAVILAPIVVGFQPMLTSTSYVTVSKARYYGAANAAVILWIDGVKASSLQDPGIARTLEELAHRYMVRPTMAVVPDCLLTSCSRAWNTLRSLSILHGWEVAVGGPVEGLEKRVDLVSEALGGYRVVTYALPDPVELLEPRSNSVTPVKLVPLPGIPAPVELDEMRLHYTVRAGQDVGWRKLLDAAVREAVLAGGVVVVYVDVDKVGYDMLEEAMEAVSGEARDYNLWVATARDLYTYKTVADATGVNSRVEDGWLIIDVEGEAQDILTVVIDHPGLHDPPMLNNTILPQLDASTQAPAEGYIEEGDRVIVNVKPPARVVMHLGGYNALLVPNGVVEAYRGVEGARILALAVWTPLLANMAIAVASLLAGRREVEAVQASYAVLIPARNSSRTIARVVLSALRQTIRPSLVAILDDASEDGTSEAAEKLISRIGLKKTNNIKLQGVDIVEYRGWARVVIARFHSHTGKAGMINRMLHLLPAEVKYLLILDSDTVIERRYVEKLMAEMKARGAEAGNGVVLLWRPDGDSRLAWAIAGALRNIGGLILSVGLRSLEAAGGMVGSLAGAAVLVSKRSLERIGGIPEKTLAEDAELTWKLGLEGMRATVAPRAIAWTIDPGSLYGVFRKALRIYQGLLASTIRLLPEAIARGRLRLAAVMLYNGLGGIPIAFSLLHLAVTLSLIAVGIGEESLAYRLALAFPYTPLSIILLPAVESPLLYLLVAYAFLSVEAVLLSMVAVMIQRDKRILSVAVSSLRYAPLFPIILWINALAMIMAVPGVMYRRMRGGMRNKW